MMGLNKQQALSMASEEIGYEIEAMKNSILKCSRTMTSLSYRFDLLKRLEEDYSLIEELGLEDDYE